MSTLVRERGPTIVVAICGFIVLLNYYVENAAVSAVSSKLVSWGSLLMSFAIGIGCISLILYAAKGLLKREDMLVNAIRVIFTTGTVLIGITMSVTSPLYSFISRYVLTPTLATTGSLLLFFIVTAILRTFKVKSIDTLIIVVTFSLVVLGNTPMGPAIWAPFNSIGPWLIIGPQVAVQRGFLIGASIGAMVLGLRILLGIEKGWLGE